MTPIPYEWPDDLRDLLVDKIGELAKDKRFTNPTEDNPFPFASQDAYNIAMQWAYEAYQLGNKAGMRAIYDRL